MISAELQEMFWISWAKGNHIIALMLNLQKNESERMLDELLF
jgi:hypothetical protein